MPARKKTIVSLTVLFVVSTTGVLLGYSYFFPGSVRHLDIIRLPIQSTIMRTFSHYTIDDLFPLTEQYDSTFYIQFHEFTRLKALLEPGDILLTNSGRYLSNSFIPGTWKHSLIYLGSRSQLADSPLIRGPVKRTLLRLCRDDHNVLILDSSEDGVAIRSFHGLSKLSQQSLLSGLSAFRINRPHEHIAAFLNFAFNQVGKPYDWDLITGNTDELYCSELIYEGLQHIGIAIETRERIAGRDVVSPNCLATYFQHDSLSRREFSTIFVVQKEIPD